MSNVRRSAVLGSDSGYTFFRRFALLAMVIRVGVFPLRIKGMPLLGLEKRPPDLHCSHGLPKFRLLRTRLSSTFGVATVAVWTTHKQTCGELGLSFRSGGIWN